MKPIKLPRWFKRVLKRQHKRVWKMMLRSARGLEPYYSEFMVGVRVSETEWKREKIPCWVVNEHEFDKLPARLKKRALNKEDLWNWHYLPLVKIKKSRLPWWLELLEVVRHDLKCPKYKPILDLLQGIVIDDGHLFIPEPTRDQFELIRVMDTPRGYFDYIPKEIFDARITTPEGTCYPLKLSR
jgi:hypothetical protein